MKFNTLVGLSGSINSGKDLVGEMLCYISQADNPTFKGFDTEVVLECPYEIKKCAEKLKEVVALVIGCTRADLEDEVFKNKELGEEWWKYEMETVDGLVTIDKVEYDKLPEDWQEGFKTVKPTPRMVLQLFGTQGGRMVVHPNIWVNALFADYKNQNEPFSSYDNGGYDMDPVPVILRESYPKWIITDVRFPENEGVAVTQRNGLLIGIKRHFALKHPGYAELADINNPYDIPLGLKHLNPKLYASLTHESEISMGDHSWCDVVIENNETIEELFNKILKAVK